ncbi:MAG: hypothetical protein JJT94_13660 [Bernardetiaceae bacterium]|nr:hypothetical protein [Bernardetiaceae bacterium]
MKKILLTQLHQKIGAVGTLPELESALTHSSFYRNEKTSKAAIGSRYVFLGQYAFKGEVARHLGQWVSGTGQQLQHFLGNLFKKQHLEGFYEKYELHDLVRYDKNFPIENHRHIFAYALLGFLYQHTARDELKFFINNQIIAPHQHLLAQSAKKDTMGQLRIKCYQVWNQHPKVSICKTEASIYEVKIHITDKILAIAQSKSETYARKKAAKNALIQVLEEELQRNEALKARIEARKAEKIAQAKAEREKLEKEYAERKQTKRKKREERIEARRKIAQLKDAQRRKAKKLAKERAANATEKQMSKKEIRDLLNSEGHLMNSAKRRKLEDKLK